MLHSRISLLIHSKSNSLHLLTPSSQSLPLLPPPPRATTSLFSMIFFSLERLLYIRYQIWVISYDICISLFDLFHSVWESLVPSMLLQMAWFCSFYGWVVFHCVYIPHLPNPVIYQYHLHLESNIQHKWTFPQKRKSWTWRIDLWLPRGRGWRREWEG